MQWTKSLQSRLYFYRQAKKERHFDLNELKYFKMTGRVYIRTIVPRMDCGLSFPCPQAACEQHGFRHTCSHT